MGKALQKPQLQTQKTSEKEPGLPRRSQSSAPRRPPHLVQQRQKQWLSPQQMRMVLRLQAHEFTPTFRDHTLNGGKTTAGISSPMA